MTDDRSHSEYEAIRNSQDRGMMRFESFVTSNLSAVQQTDKMDLIISKI